MTKTQIIYDAARLKQQVEALIGKVSNLETIIDGYSYVYSILPPLVRNKGLRDKVSAIEELLTPDCKCCKKSLGVLHISQNEVTCKHCAEFLKPKKRKK